MDPNWRRIVGTIVLTIPISTVMIRGGLRDVTVPAWVMLGAAALVAITVYRMWPMFDNIWQRKVPIALTWKRVSGGAVVGLLLTIAIVLVGRWFGRDLDPWLVLAFLVLGAMLSFVNDWEDGTIRWWSRG